MHIYIYVYVYIYINVCIHVYIYIHVYTYTLSQFDDHARCDTATCVTTFSHVLDPQGDIFVDARCHTCNVSYICTHTHTHTHERVHAHIHTL